MCIRDRSQAAELSEELDFGGDFDEMEDFDLEAPAEETEEVSELTEAGESSSEAVSYTHLDVYKRQT